MSKQNPFLSFIWPAVLITLGIWTGIIYHANYFAWLAGGLFWLVGLIILIHQYLVDEESIFPHSLVAIGTVMVWIIAAS